MNALEQEIIEKFRQLDRSSKQWVLKRLADDMQTTFDYARWWSDVEALQTTMRLRLGAQATVGGLSLLDELREEAS